MTRSGSRFRKFSYSEEGAKKYSISQAFVPSKPQILKMKGFTEGLPGWKVVRVKDNKTRLFNSGKGVKKLESPFYFDTVFGGVLRRKQITKSKVRKQ